MLEQLVHYMDLHMEKKNNKKLQFMCLWYIQKWKMIEMENIKLYIYKKKISGKNNLVTLR